MSAETTPREPEKHVVVLDDDIIVLRATARLLRAAGMRVTPTTSAKEAMEHVVCDSADAIVSDLHMPDLGGHLVLAMLARAAPSAARVLMTSETDFARVAELLVPYSVDALIAKPDAAVKLVPMLRDLLSSPRGTSTTRGDNARAHARTIVRALALREYETESHCERVAAWSKRIAQELELSPTKILEVELGALLHDAGMLGVRESIIQKPGPLSPDERLELRRHPDLGAALLTEIPVLAGALAIVQNHHERVDGSGYPRGLLREDIPLGARIFAVADAYDAIVSDRPYRRGQPDASARQEIASVAGVQFDRQVVDAFLRIDVVDWLLVGQRAVGQATDRPPAPDHIDA
jgi:hypothetical protein